jgi:hypothetical protein
MMKVPEPATREQILNVADDKKEIYDAVPVGEGVKVVYHREEDHERLYTDLVENYGWYVAAYEPLDAGDTATLMPIPRGGSHE